MSLNNNAHTSTPTIVRDIGRFVNVSITDTAAVATLGVSGATTLAGTLTANGVSTFNAAANFNQAVTIGTSVMTTATVNSLLYAVNGGTIGADSSSTLTVNSTETHNGPETHSGSFTASGTNSFTGPTTAASGMDRVLLTSTPIGADISVTWNGTENFLIVSPTTSGLLVRMIADGSTPNNVRKTIKNSYGSGYNITVIDNTTSTTLAVLTPGAETTVVSLSGRWR